jgi:hypothetical protein
VNNKTVIVCMSRAVVHDLCYVSHIVQVLDIESALATPLFGFPVLHSCESWLQLPAAVGNVLPLYVVLPRPTLHVEGDVRYLGRPVLRIILALISTKKGQT